LPKLLKRNKDKKDEKIEKPGGGKDSPRSGEPESKIANPPDDANKVKKKGILKNPLKRQNSEKSPLNPSEGASPVGLETKKERKPKKKGTN